LLFLILLVVTLTFKKWKKIFLLIGFLSISYFVGITLIFYGNLNFKLDVIKFIIPVIIFSLAITNILYSVNTFKFRDSINYIFVILFGFFNGLGTSTDLSLLFSRNEIEILQILEVVFGFGTAISIIVFLMLIVNLLFQKIVPLIKVKWVVGYSIIVIFISLPMIFKQLFH
tara:strand:+ start:1801 stop:2313 length:513 start_codon:yes stop_codon:yes gene_type:complete